MTLHLGDTVGSYEVIGVLGSGGSGRVFEVKHLLTGRVEALKLLYGAGDRDPRRDEQLLQEVRLQAKLDHPNIAAVHNAFWLGDDLVMVMELMRGRSLRRSLDLGRLPIPTVLDYVGQALCALDYTHKVGVIHRDISPSNILITPEGVIKLSDFGLAQPLGGGRPAGGAYLAGSAYYMSPEQIRATEEIDHRSDLYSLGVVLYEMVTGRVPFRAGNLYELMEAHVEQPPPEPKQLTEQVPPVLNDVILKALQKKPEQRFQSAAEFEDALAAVDTSETSHPAVSQAPAAAEPARGNQGAPHEILTHEKQVRFTRPVLPAWAATAAAAMAAACLAALLVLVFTASDAPPPTESKLMEPSQGSRESSEISVPPGEFVGPPLPEEWVEQEAVPSPPETPARVSALRPAPAKRAAETKLPPKVTVRDRSGTTAAGERSRGSPGVSAPGDSRASTRRQVADLGVLPAPDIVAPVEETEAVGPGSIPEGQRDVAFKLLGRFNVGDTVWSLAFSHDGQRIAAGTEDRGVVVLEAGSGATVATFDGHNERVVAVAFGPDGKQLATGSSDGTAKIWNLVDKRESRTLGHKAGVTSLAFSPDGRRLASGSSDNAVNLWDLSRGGAFQEYRGHKRPAQAVAFSPNGKTLASGSLERVVHLWFVDGPDRPQRLEGLENGAAAVAFSPDGRSLAVAGGNYVKLMDIEKRRQLRATYIPGWRYAIAFSNSGRCLALSAQSAAPDTVKLWDISKLEPLTTLRQTGTVRSIAITPDGARLAAATDTGSIAVWEQVSVP